MYLKRLSRWVFILLIGVGPASESRGDNSVNVPLDHWGYGFIERFEAKGFLYGVGDGIKPFSRLEMARALTSIAAEGDKGRRLSRIEKRELLLLLEEFQDQIKGPGARDRSEYETMGERFGNGQPLLRYAHEQGELWADLRVRQQTDVFEGRTRGATEQIFRQRLGGSMRGYFEDRIGFWVSFEQTREQGSRSYTLRDDVFERRLELPQPKGALADYHEAKAYMVFSLPLFRVELGKDVVSWGPAPDDNLGLSNNAPSFDMLRLRARYGVFKLVGIAGVLRPCPDRTDTPLCRGLLDSTTSYIVHGVGRRLEREKYLAAHRLEVALATWLDLGFQEVLVYGDRGLELTYLNPIMPYQAAQSYLGDKDNLMMGVDLDVHPGKGLRLYLAYVIDDMRKLRIFSDDFVNKFSLQAGLLWVDPLRLRDADLRMEYVRLEPWVFTHKIPINTFRHFTAPLGHVLGPNSDRWRLGLKRRFTRNLEATVELSRTRHGDNEVRADGSIRNVGGDLHLGRRAGDETETKQFLDGVVSRWTEIGGRMTWRVWPQLRLETGYRLEWGDHVPLPPRWGPNVALKNRSGYGDGRQQHFSFDLRYGYF